MGSYWIYKNETTLKSDSAYVFNLPISNLDNLNYMSDNEVFNEVLIYDIKGPCFGHFSIKAEYGQEYLTSSTPFGMTGLLVHNYETGYQVIESIPNLNINDHNYTNVLHTRNIVLGNVHADTIIIETFFAKNVGIIKYTHKIGTADTTWSLISSHTVQ